MQSLPEAETPQVVFTATFGGLYVLTVLPYAFEHVLYLNGDVISVATAVVGPGDPWPQGTRVLYLESGDEIAYKGPAAQLAGFRIGDEFSD